MNVLIVEDEVIAANYLKQIVLQAGFNVIDIVSEGSRAVQIAELERPDLILMDIMLADSMSGVDAAINIRISNKNVVIIFLTAYAEESMVDAAIEAGALCYFVKPYNKDEILANLKIVHAKYHNCNKKEAGVLHLADGYSYNQKEHRLYRANREVFLSKQELQIVEYLCTNCNAILDDERISLYLWGRVVSSQTLRSLIHRIRDKTSKNLIVNINRVGYKIGFGD